MVEIIQTKKGLLEYRSEGNGPVVLVLNGGHTNCCSPFEHEEFFLGKGYRLVIPSRPGYGRTPSISGRTAEEFAHTLSSLLDALMIDKVIVIGISAAGRTALHFAGNYPNRVTKLILESAVTCEAWPDSRTRRGALIVFNRLSEKFTWALLRQIGRYAPDLFLKLLLPALSSLKADEVIKSWDENERRAVLKFLLASRSGAGFLNDIKHTFDDFTQITVPTLIIASTYDKSVSPENSIKAAKQIKGAELMMIPAQSHLIWFSKYKTEIENKIAEFIQD
ncbi:aromatic hydrocarbon catabolism protein [Desulfocucumis palustris]|uniref:Aromatic hydrocarbon catabolism protein n=1 Tax=Desulfocucumis palustris TaxID=1898651 RepID=A0A2L2XG74_9FIRM|nr:alpha/beta hydrolase [Desulfocucumis palustris]GBF33226.1 aromatic hydrocarbon catabolism protein [Desulfocucumis palustris]